MNFDREINKVAEILGMVPGDKVRFDYDEKKVRHYDEDHDGRIFVEYIILNLATLKEGKSGRTTLRFQGRVKYSNRENEIWREVAPWEIHPEDLIGILDEMKK